MCGGSLSIGHARPGPSFPLLFQSRETQMPLHSIPREHQPLKACTSWWRSRSGRSTGIAVWCLLGFTCLSLDEYVQPKLTYFGQNTWAGPVAERWQQLGATAGIVTFLFAGLCDWPRRGHQTVARFAACAIAVGIAVQTVKYAIGRARPNSVNDATKFFGPFGLWNDGKSVPIDSMPSGHTAAAFAMAYALTRRWPRMACGWYLLAIGVAISRTIVDRHFPSDVVFGALLGTLVAWWAWWCLEKRALFPGRFAITKDDQL